MRRLAFPALIVALVAAAFACGDTLPEQASDADDASAGGDGAAIDGATSSDAGDGAAATAPCPNASCGTVVSDTADKATEVIVDELRVYWASSSGPVRARPLDLSGAPYAITNDSASASGVSKADTDWVYWYSGSQVKYIQRDSNSAGSSIAATAPGSITSTLRAENHLFATAGTGVGWCSLGGTNKCANAPFDASRDLGTPTRALAFDDTRKRIWLATDEAIWSVPAAAPLAGAFIEEWKATGVTQLLVDQTAVYVARKGAKGIARYGADDPMGTQPNVHGGYEPWAMAMDGVHVYYTSFDDGIVARVDKSTGTEELVAVQLPRPQGIAVYGKSVYVVLSDGRIVSLPKP